MGKITDFLIALAILVVALVEELRDHFYRRTKEVDYGATHPSPHYSGKPKNRD